MSVFLDRKEYLNLTIDLLELLNHKSERISTIREILLLIKRYSDFEAVGIRLKEDYDFPYYVTNGFPKDFIEAERYLCATDKNGETILDSEGIEVIPAEGKKFDPNFHDAISYEESEEHEDCQIIEVIKQGYQLGDRVIRPAVVRVAK